MTPGDMIEQMLANLADRQRHAKGLARLGYVAVVAGVVVVAMTAYGALKGPLWSRAINLGLVYVNVWNLQSAIRRVRRTRRTLREMQQFRDVLELEKLAQL